MKNIKTKRQFKAQLCKVQKTPGFLIIGNPESRDISNPFAWEVTCALQQKDYDPVLRVWVIYGKTEQDMTANLQKRAWEEGYHFVGILEALSPKIQTQEKEDLLCQAG